MSPQQEKPTKPRPHNDGSNRRFDKEEANAKADGKRHDNPNHPSQRSHNRRKAQATDDLEEFLKELINPGTEDD